MSIESILGIIASILTIAAFIGIKCDLIRYIKKPPMTKVFSELMDNKTTDTKRRKILKELNGYSLIKNRISNEYIQNFSLGKRGKEDVLFDICDCNEIEPVSDICNGMLGYDSNSLRKKYEAKRQTRKEEPTPAPVEPVVMEEPKESPAQPSGEQTVYMSKLLQTRYPETCDRLIRILEKHSVRYKFLEGTKDIWCRDYMPVQARSGKLVQFKYDPSYLKGSKELEDSRSDVKEVCKANGITAQPSDINLDGGNVLICEDRAIISDRIFSENEGCDQKQLVDELSNLLGCEIIIIPALRSKEEDFTGHADGMVRFVNRNTILGNRLAGEYKYIQDGMQKVIDKYGLTYIDVPFFEAKDKDHPDSAIGIYVNYLEVNNLIVMPEFGREEDKQAYAVIQKAFPDKVVETIDYNDVALEGGLLNCTTWVV